MTDVWLTVGLTLGTTLVSIIVGGVITYLVSHHYSRKGAQELKQELEAQTDQAKFIIDALAIRMQEAEIITGLRIDSNGNVQWTRPIGASVRGNFNVNAKPTNDQKRL
jgi:hypothetical protein